MITTWGHDPGIVPVSNVLLALNDALSHSAVLVQVSLEPISMETDRLLPNAVLLLFKRKYRVSWVVEREQSLFPVIASLDQERNFSAGEKQRPEIRQHSQAISYHRNHRILACAICPCALHFQTSTAYLPLWPLPHLDVLFWNHFRPSTDYLNQS